MTQFLKAIVLVMALTCSSLAWAEEAYFAGGCFWCMESDFEKLPGVLDVVSGFTGIVVARVHYLNGCVQYGIQGKVKGDGSMGVVEYFDLGRMEMDEKISMMTAQSKLTAWIVGLSPFLFLGMMAFLSPEVVGPLFTTKIGLILLGMVVLLVGSGGFFVYRMARVE